jgi:class 3 adenylate cyclase
VKILAYLADETFAKMAALLEHARSADFELEFLPRSSLGRNGRKKALDSFVYLDAEGLDTDRVLGLGSRLGEFGCVGWGVLDRGGTVDDPARLFFEGARDYVGPQLLKATATRNSTQAKPAQHRSAFNADRISVALTTAGLIGGNDLKLPPPFPGWDRLEEGTGVVVRFCYAAIGNQHELLERIGEKRLFKLREDFVAFLGPWAAECGGIVWIRVGSGNLLLFPPADEGINPVLAAFRILLDRALIGYEVFRLETPLSFRFAFHAGRTMWRKPGATGDVVSEDVNFIFHLGARASPDGLIVVTECAESLVPACLRDLFVPGGDYEGRALFASKRFKD